ncbi:hypothetical protein SARC_06592 [Sphaeroforma arctica JP610]|uniref:Pre-mRNA-splicing factor RBM22 n=1 Tax=Sphaeroforma arctica JP610 TaxID=667725 RepID=A0A0L0FWS6_9EUKA|nr:hypothetical protein SARC_06592 [Sphaeroforma arctica JP610]KNC81069.1 hypothetical protein SARC_06592 [Sphaeroforma arctica JP610]|eukprot:XP_014154971.1 hypothetical protein SARC_06592 [Sphaeroforma arctica JP610]
MSLQTKGDPTKQHWEDSDFPILCQTCLGDNPYMRMTKEKHGKECKICTRPFTVFRWCPGRGMRFKKTEVCQTCAKVKNVCQTCIFDLQYGLPVQVRDQALGIVDNVPKSAVNKEYYAQNMEAQMAVAEPGALAIDMSGSGTLSVGGVGGAVGGVGGGGGGAPGGVGVGGKVNNAYLKTLARTGPYYKRNRAHICSFWVKGNCNRGEECPYRHEMPTDPNNPLAKQNIKDRYYGVNDPVADKIIERAASRPRLEPPADKSVMTLYLGNIDPAVTEQDIRDVFYQHGTITNITLVSKQGCAFLEYSARSEAERAAEKSYNSVLLKGKKIKILWGKSKSQQSQNNASANINLQPVPGLPPSAKTGPGPGPPGVRPPQQKGLQGIHYPSQDPTRMGTSGKR